MYVTKYMQSSKSELINWRQRGFFPFLNAKVSPRLLSFVNYMGYRREKKRECQNIMATLVSAKEISEAIKSASVWIFLYLCLIEKGGKRSP